MLWVEEEQEPDAWVKEGTDKNEVVSLEHPLKQTAFLEEGLKVLNGMKEMLIELEQPTAIPLIGENDRENATTSRDFSRKNLSRSKGKKSARICPEPR